MNPKSILDQLRQEFSAAADPNRAIRQQKYMKSRLPYYGLPTELNRKLSMKIFKKHPPQDNTKYREIILYLFNNATHREEWYAGMALAQRFPKYIRFENLDLYLTLVRIAQWWDIVDTAAAHLLGGVMRGRSDLGDTINNWADDENMWVRRCALLTQLRYKEDTDFDLLKKIILKLCGENEFFIRKAIGWSLREYSYVNPNGVKAFIQNNQQSLSTLSQKEGLKAIMRQRQNG